MTLPADATTDPEASSLSPLRKLSGTVIDDRYQIGELLGCGGMGAVYEAMQLELDRKVAIKILNPAYMHRDDYLARFMQEAKAASRIRHENVVQMLDFGKLPSGSVYSVMELLQGRDLSRHLKEVGKLQWPRARDLLIQLVRGVKAAHAQGVIHRDIKPANLFLTHESGESREVLKVLDFGVARVQSNADHDTAALTGTADLLGTPAYMAPELARGRRACPRTEVYSVGVVAFQMLTGRVPFRGESAFDALFRAATEPTPPLRSFEPTVPDAVEELVQRMLAKDPQDRFADMGELLSAISTIDEAGHGPPSAGALAHPSLADTTVVGPPPATGPQPIVAPTTTPTPSFTTPMPGFATPTPGFATPTPGFATPAPTPMPTPHTGPQTILAAQQSSHSMVAPRPARARGPITALLAIGAIAVVVAIAIAATRGERATPEPRPSTAAVTPPATTPAPEPAPAPLAPAPTVEPAEADAGIELVIDDEPGESARPPKLAPVRTPAAAKPTPPPRVEEPPSDAAVLKKLQRQAKSKCGALLAGEPLRVTFGIGQRGEVIAPRGNRRGPATDCVLEVIDGARFSSGSMRREVLTL